MGGGERPAGLSGGRGVARPAGREKGERTGWAKRGGGLIEKGKSKNGFKKDLRRIQRRLRGILATYLCSPNSK